MTWAPKPYGRPVCVYLRDSDRVRVEFKRRDGTWVSVYCKTAGHAQALQAHVDRTVYGR